MNYTVKYGEEIDGSNENKPVDMLAHDLLNEILSRRETIQEHQAHIENFPLGNEYEPERDKRFTGMEQLRNISRNNYAKVIVDAVTSKCGIEGFRTAVSSDETGDIKALELFERDGMGFAMQDAIELACTYRKSYLFVDPVTGRQKILTPTNAALLLDINDEPVGAVVLTREKALKRDTLRVFIRDIDEETGAAVGKVRQFIATRDIEARYPLNSGIRVSGHDSEVPLSSSIRNGWVWWKEVTGLKTERVPVTVLKGKDDKNEFEDATDTISRINHIIWQRVIIITMQAFRQRAIKGNLPKKDASGRDIDYGAIFEPGPGALWLLPENSEMWESSPADMTSLLDTVRADEKALGAQTKTPMNHFSDSVNNSAEGAASQKEAYYDKIADRRRRFGSKLSRHMSILMEVNGEKERSAVEAVEVIWSPIESLSLNERTAAFASLRGQGIAVETALREGMKMGPGEIRRAMEELNKDTLRMAMTSSINQTTPLAKARQGNQSQANVQTKPTGQTSETIVKAKTEGRVANQ